MGIHRLSTSLAISSVLLGGCLAMAAERPAPRSALDACVSYDPDSGEPLIDANCFFRLLVSRYQGLAVYEDVSRVLRVTQRAGEEPERVETEIGCEIEDGELRVETAGSQALGLLGLNDLFRSSPEMNRAGLQYDLWLAPHLIPRFAADADLPSFGVDGELAPMTAEAVTIDDKPMILLAVEEARDRQQHGQTSLDLYVNPDSMLVERAERRETLPDGARYRTTVEITPSVVQTRETPVETGQPTPDEEPGREEPRTEPASPPMTQSFDPRSDVE